MTHPNIFDRIQKLKKKAIDHYIDSVGYSHIVEYLPNDDYMEWTVLNTLEQLQYRDEPKTAQAVVNMIGYDSRYSTNETFKLVYKLAEKYGVEFEE